MTFSQFVSILKARWWLVLLVIALFTGGAVGISLLLPKEYKASASVVLDFKPDPVSAMLYGGGTSPALMATQVDIIKSDRVAQRVVRNLKLNENPQIRQQWQEETDGQGAIEAWLATLFQRKLDVEPSRESSVITVHYRAADSRFAAALANAFVRAYLDTALELRVDPARQYSAFFDVRAKEARDSLERAQARVSAFQKEKGIIATDERLDVENTRLNELSSQLTMIQALASESNSRQAQAQGGQGDRMQEVLNNPIVGSLKAEVNRAEARLQELSTRLGDNHPQVLEARASSQELRNRLDAETRKVTSGVTVSNTINRQRESEIRASLEAQRGKVLRMKAVRDEGMVLVRDVENAHRAYDAVLQRFTQTNLESQATQSNVNVLTEAAAPLRPSSPRTVLNTIIAAILGTLFAIGLALILELRDRRIRRIDDLVEALGMPVIGALPGPGSKFRLGGRHSLMQQRLLAPLPAPGRAS
jgi:succinoglycan biosynthesis transport protein ExoP